MSKDYQKQKVTLEQVGYGILFGNKVHLKTYKENVGNSRNVY